MTNNNDKSGSGFRETRLLITNSAIASKQAALGRVQKKIDELLATRLLIESELEKKKEIRDELILERWEESGPEWGLILTMPERHSNILAKRAEEEIGKAGFFSAGYFERNQQRALGLSINGKTSDDEIMRLESSVKTVFPFLYALTEGERAIMIYHDSPESFSLQLRQVVTTSEIFVVSFLHGLKQASKFKSISDALIFIRNNMTDFHFNLSYATDL